MSLFGVIRDAITGLTAGVAARAQTPTGNALQVQIGPGDVISNIPVMIDYDHHQVHEGESFQFDWYGTINNTSKDFRLVVPNVAATVRTPHFLPEVIADGAAFVYLYEAPTFSSNGTQDTSAKNRNRNIADSPGMTVYVSGGTALTVSTTGTLIWTGWLTGSKTSTNIDRALSEWDLKSNTQYLLRITTSSNVNVLVRMNWYEDLGV